MTTRYARYSRSVGGLSLVIGVWLFCQASLVVSGGHYPWYCSPIAAAFAAIAIPTGWREHRDEQRLRIERGLGRYDAPVNPAPASPGPE
ncbi:MAG: hypothetical protein ACOH1R_04765 [Luteimonas sp.]